MRVFLLALTIVIGSITTAMAENQFAVGCSQTTAPTAMRYMGDFMLEIYDSGYGYRVQQLLHVASDPDDMWKFLARLKQQHDPVKRCEVALQVVRNVYDNKKTETGDDMAALSAAYKFASMIDFDPPIGLDIRDPVR